MAAPGQVRRRPGSRRAAAPVKAHDLCLLLVDQKIFAGHCCRLPDNAARSRLSSASPSPLMAEKLTRSYWGSLSRSCCRRLRPAVRSSLPAISSSGASDVAVFSRISEARSSTGGEISQKIKSAWFRAPGPGQTPSLSISSSVSRRPAVSTR